MAATLQVVVGTYEFLTLGYELKEIDKKSTFTLRFTDHDPCGQVRRICLSEGNVLATGSTDGTIKLINLKKNTPIGKIGHHKDEITCVQFFGKWNLFSSSVDGTIVVWDKSWEVQRILRGHTSAVNSFSIHPSGKMALSVSKDNTLRLWNLMTAKCAYVTKIRQASTTVLWSPDGDTYVVVYARHIDIYSRETSQITHTVQLGFRTTCVVFLTTNVIAVCGDGGFVEFHNVVSKDKLYDFVIETVRARCMAVVTSKEEEDKSIRLVFATSEGFIKLYSVSIESSAAVACELVAEINTGFRLLSLVASVMEIKPTKLELVAAAEQLTAIDEKPILLPGEKKNGRSAKVIVQENSSSEDDVVMESEEEEEVEIKKKPKTKNRLRKEKESRLIRKSSRAAAVKNLDVSELKKSGKKLNVSEPKKSGKKLDVSELKKSSKQFKMAKRRKLTGV